MKRPHRAAHSAIWAALAIAVPALLIAAMVLKQDFDQRGAQERLSPPASDAGGVGGEG